MQQHTDPQRAERRHSDSDCTARAEARPPPLSHCCLPAPFGYCGVVGSVPKDVGLNPTRVEVVGSVPKDVGLNPTRVEHHCQPEDCLILVFAHGYCGLVVKDYI